MAGSELAPITVLHVEDDPDFARLCATFLERQSVPLRIQTAHEPTVALAAIEREPVDCVVSDYDMPGMDGVDLLATVRDEFADLPFILFTGKGSEEVAEEAIGAGVTDYLQKNGHAEQYAVLANRIRNAVESYRREQAVEEYFRQLEAITEHTHDAIVTVDADSRIRFANPAVEDLFGYAPAELVDESLTALMPERYRERHRRGIERYCRTGERAVSWSNVAFDGRHRSGDEIPLSISFGAFTHDGDQRFIGIMRERDPDAAGTD